MQSVNSNSDSVSHSAIEGSTFSVRILVDSAADHPGAASSFAVDGCVGEATLARLEAT
jgi:hypothetical protein